MPRAWERALKYRRKKEPEEFFRRIITTKSRRYRGPGGCLRAGKLIGSTGNAQPTKLFRYPVEVNPDQRTSQIKEHGVNIVVRDNDLLLFCHCAGIVNLTS